MARELQPLTIQPIKYSDFADPSDNDRPPDAAIRATAAIIGAGLASTSQLMAAVAGGGLNIVVSGSNPTALRAPQKIAGLNGNDLAALGQLGSNIAGAAGEPKKTVQNDGATAPVSDPKPTDDSDKPVDAVSKDDAGTKPDPVDTGAEEKPEDKPVKKSSKKETDAARKNDFTVASNGPPPLEGDTNGDGVLNSDDDLDKNGDGVLNSDDDVQDPNDQPTTSVAGGDPAPVSAPETSPDAETSSEVPTEGNPDAGVPTVATGDAGTPAPDAG